MATDKAVTIVIIDDEKSFAEMLGFALKNYGYNIIIYNDSKQALLNVCENKPNLVILDLLMPYINGFDFISHLKSYNNTCNYKILILTNLDMTESGIKIDDNFAISIGAVGVIKKTSNLIDIVDKIRKFV